MTPISGGTNSVGVGQIRTETLLYPCLKPINTHIHSNLWPRTSTYAFGHGQSPSLPTSKLATQLIINHTAATGLGIHQENWTAFRGSDEL